MSRPTYLTDSYKKELTTKVASVKDKFVVLEDTIFYPRSGGQPHDTGTITKGDETYTVVFVGKFDGNISHEVDKEGLQVGDEITLNIDWDRRYALMRMHTAAHIFMQAMHTDTGALGTGNELDVEKSRIDFSLEDYNQELVDKAIATANAVIAQDLPISVQFLARDEAMKIPGITKLAMGLPEHIQDVRILSIGDYDVQADGGTHVHSTKEVGTIVFIKSENKGKGRKRVQFRLDMPAMQ